MSYQSSNNNNNNRTASSAAESMDLHSQGGTPFANMFRCCFPTKHQQPDKKSRSVDFAGTATQKPYLGEFRENAFSGVRIQKRKDSLTIFCVIRRSILQQNTRIRTNQSRAWYTLTCQMSKTKRMLPSLHHHPPPPVYTHRHLSKNFGSLSFHSFCLNGCARRINRNESRMNRPKNQ